MDNEIETRTILRVEIRKYDTNHISEHNLTVGSVYCTDTHKYQTVIHIQDTTLYFTDDQRDELVYLLQNNSD